VRNEQNGPLIESTKIKVIELIIDSKAHGWSPEKIQFQYPHLTLDLLAEAARRQRLDISFHGVIYAHQLRVSIGACIHDLEIIAKAGEPADLVGQIQFLPL
jgi:hypothetical protein